MHLAQKTLKAFSFELLSDLENSLLDTLETGVEKEWNKWFKVTNEGILEKAKNTALKNKRAIDFSEFSSFKQNIDFADPVELIISFASKGNKYFKKFFKEKSEKNYLLQAIGESNRFRNLIYHPAGKTLYISDIREFLRSSQVICNLLGMCSLGVKFKNIEKDIENSIIESPHFLKDNIETIYNNLPKPDYEDWYGLVGRTKIKSEIISDFQKGHNRVIAITGGGGIGKSALAQDICYEFLKPTNFLFQHIIWITSKNNFLDYSGINLLRPDYFYSNNYKDFLNQFISGFYQELFVTNLELVTEEKLEKEVSDLFSCYNRILCVVDNLENIDDPKILDFIKNKVIPPNYVLITSRKGLGEINKTYKLEPLDDDSALLLFENLCKSPLFNINYANVNTRKIRELISKTNNYPLVIKWCLSLVANKKMELEAAFSELNKSNNALLEFIFQKLYKQLSKSSKRILRSLALYKDIPDRNIISYIAELDTEDALMDSIYELEQHSLIKQERIDSKNGIIETINLLGLAQTFINNISDLDKDIKERYERRIIEIEKELDKISSDENRDFRPAQKLAQSKLLEALKYSSENVIGRKKSDPLVKEAERLAPRFYLIPFYKALIEMNNPKGYEYGNVKQHFIESLALDKNNSRVFFEYGLLIKKHKRESYKEYAPIFHRAFQLEEKIGYGIEAGLAYSENGNYTTAYEIIQKLKIIEPLFPRDRQNKIWTSKTIMALSEKQVLKDPQNAMSLFNSIEENIDLLTQDKSQSSRMLRAKFCSLLSLTYSLCSEPLKSREFLTISKEIVTIYKSVSANSFETKELSCYNYAIESILSKDKLYKIKMVSKIENEFLGTFSKELHIKFNPLLKLIKKTIPPGQ